MGDDFLTILIVNDAEKDPVMLKRCFAGLTRLNDPAGVQFIVINQNPNHALIEDIVSQAWPASRVYHTNDPVAGNAVMWNLMASIDKVLPLCRGEYVILLHNEFLCAPYCLQDAMKWLMDNQPIVALGNLRRIGMNRRSPSLEARAQSEQKASAPLFDMLDSYRFVDLADALAKLPSYSWTRNSRCDGRWKEDVFFCRRQWLQSCGLTECSKDMMFEDVYNLMGIVMQIHDESGHQIQCPTAPTTFFHLHHPKIYAHFSEEAHQWFASNADKWAGTRFLDKNEFLELRRLRTHNFREFKSKLVTQFRRGREGNLDRFKTRYQEWFASNDSAILKHRISVTSSRASDNIVANMATHPQRRGVMIQAVLSLANQCRINVWGNGYDYIPQELNGIPNVRFLPSQRLDLGAAGKMAFLDSERRRGAHFYLSVDDDMLYPNDYVANIVQSTRDRRQLAVVSYHGVSFRPNQTPTLQNRIVHSACSDVLHEYEVPVLGTGVMCIPIVHLRISLSDLAFGNMIDPQIAAIARSRSVRQICLPHRKGYIKAIVGYPKTSSVWGMAKQHPSVWFKMYHMAISKTVISQENCRVAPKEFIPLTSEMVAQAVQKVACEI